MPNTRLAFLFMNSCHQDDHTRDPRNAMARARTITWIPRSPQLAVKVAKECHTCRREEKRLAQRQMGELPGARAGGVAPFMAVAYDFKGPYEVKGRCNCRRIANCKGRPWHKGRNRLKKRCVERDCVSL